MNEESEKTYSFDMSSTLTFDFKEDGPNKVERKVIDNNEED